MHRKSVSVLIAMALITVATLSLAATAAEWEEVLRFESEDGRMGRCATSNRKGLTLLLKPDGDRFEIHVSRIWVPQSRFDTVRVVLQTADGKRHPADQIMMSGGGSIGDTALQSWLFQEPDGCPRDQVRAVIVEALTAEGITMAEARHKAHEKEVEQARGNCPLPAPEVGKPYPFTLTALDGRTLDSDKLKGMVVVLDFWATWCMPCRAEFPAMKALHQKHHGDGLRIIGISFDDDAEMTRATVEKHGLPWPQVLVGDQVARQALGKQTGVTAIPRYFVIDKAGNLHTDHGRGKLDELLPELLAR